jgi:hypothetical protein
LVALALAARFLVPAAACGGGGMMALRQDDMAPAMSDAALSQADVLAGGESASGTTIDAGSGSSTIFLPGDRSGDHEHHSIHSRIDTRSDGAPRDHEIQGVEARRGRTRGPRLDAATSRTRRRREARIERVERAIVKLDRIRRGGMAPTTRRASARGARQQPLRAQRGSRSRRHGPWSHQRPRELTDKCSELSFGPARPARPADAA